MWTATGNGLGCRFAFMMNQGRFRGGPDQRGAVVTGENLVVVVVVVIVVARTASEVSIALLVGMVGLSAGISMVLPVGVHWLMRFERRDSASNGHAGDALAL